MRLTSRFFLACIGLSLLLGCMRPQTASNRLAQLSGSAQVSSKESDATEAFANEALVKVNLYNENCSGCHGRVEVSTKRGASVVAIKEAIAHVPEMAHLKILTPEQIQEIHEALSNDRLICRDKDKPGPVVVRRLSKIEHANTLVDLLGLTYSPLADLPDDARGKSFSNISSLQIISDVSLEVTLKATEKAVAAFWSDSTSSKAKYLGCDIAAANALNACVPGFLERFAYHAFRRPVANAELSPYVELIKARQMNGDDAASSVQSALVAMLMSPSFLYRTEVDSLLNVSGDVYELNDFELAARLSYFLWGTMPDEELLDAAKKQTLADNLAPQVKRMLAHPKSDFLIDTFASEWMHLYRLHDKQPSGSMFKNFDPAMFELMQKENNEFFSYFKKENLNLLGMFDAPFTFVNAKLASFYGLGGVAGEAFQKTELPASSRRSGLLSQGAILAVTSGNAATSPVLRGRWVIDQILCAPLPNPPDDIAPLPEPDGATSIKQRLDMHRVTPSCGSCHSVIDPPGFALEHFNAIGLYRDVYEDGLRVDATGTLPNGQNIDGVVELAQQLKADPATATCMVRHFLTFALGTEQKAQDTCTVEAVTEAAKAKGFTFEGIIEAIIESPSFLQRTR